MTTLALGLGALMLGLVALGRRAPSGSRFAGLSDLGALWARAFCFDGGGARWR